MGSRQVVHGDALNRRWRGWYTPMMTTIADALLSTIAAWSVQTDDPLYLEQRIFGTSDPQQIARQVEAFCAARLGAPVEDALFWSSNIGSVFGVLLADCRRVVIKASRPTVRIASLSAVQRVQRFLAARHFPCPPLLLGPVPLAAGHAMVEEMVDVGSYADAHDPPIRCAMARTFVELVALCRQLGSMPDLQSWVPPASSSGPLWPTPHHPMFDFAATGAGAGWIDDLARSAQVTRAEDSSQFVIGHADWTAKHFRFSDAVPTVIYDWDSLVHIREAQLVGIAGATFTMTWELPVALAPRPEETDAFTAEYEHARGATFSAEDRRAIGAHATYTMAYGARCEHAIDPNAAPFPPGSQRAALALRRAAIQGIG